MQRAYYLAISFFFSVLPVPILHALTGKDLFIGSPSAEYISRWRFQRLCKFYYDPYRDTSKSEWATKLGGISFKPNLVKPGDIIFVRQINKFFSKMVPRIKHPFIIITHGDYRDAFLPSYTRYLDSHKVIAWFSIHSSIHHHPKFFAIPIGIFQGAELHQDKNQIHNLFTYLRAASTKHKLLYINFNVKETKPERIKLLQYFKKKPFCTFASAKPFTDYITEMAQFKFVLSPPGLQIDCYRTWEALLLGSIPIVKSSYLNPLYEQLPVLVINNWKEITKEFLERKYQEIVSRKYNIEKLYIEYWANKIEEVRSHFLQHYKKALEQPLHSLERSYLMQLAVIHKQNHE